MPAFGRDGMLKRDEVLAAADYVRSLSGLSTTAGADLARGGKIFADNCAACHGSDGKGNRALGAPNLTDRIWLYGSDSEAIIDGIWNGHNGVMPAWGGKLDPSAMVGDHILEKITVNITAPSWPISPEFTGGATD